MQMDVDFIADAMLGMGSPNSKLCELNQKIEIKGKIRHRVMCNLENRRHGRISESRPGRARPR